MEPDNKQREILITLVGTASAALVFVLVREPLGDFAAVVSAVPIGLVAFYFGTRPGLLAATIAFPFNTFLLDLFFGSEDTGLSVVSAIISLSLVGVAWLFGRFHKLSETMQLREQEHRRAQTALETSEERMRGFLSASPDIIFRVGPGGRLLEIHGEEGLGMGLTRDQYLFRPLADVMPHRAATKILLAVGEARSNGSAMTLLDVAIDDRVRSFQINLALAGEYDVVAVARDVTEFLATEDEKHAMEIGRARDDLIDDVVHELRAPLSGILQLSHELRSRSSMDPASLEALDVIAEQGVKISERLDDLSIAAQVESGSLVLHPQIVNLLDVTNNIVIGFDHNIAVEFDRVEVQADREKLGHILRNLIGNAVEHGGPNITLTSHKNERRVTLRIADDGAGMSVEMEEVFGPHAEPGGTNTKVGVGLAVAKQLANLMKGDLVYQREEGQTTFDLSLPVA